MLQIIVLHHHRSEIIKGLGGGGALSAWSGKRSVPPIRGYIHCTEGGGSQAGLVMDMNIESVYSLKRFVPALLILVLHGFFLWNETSSSHTKTIISYSTPLSSLADLLCSEVSTTHPLATLLPRATCSHYHEHGHFLIRPPGSVTTYLGREVGLIRSWKYSQNNTVFSPFVITIRLLGVQWFGCEQLCVSTCLV